MKIPIIHQNLSSLLILCLLLILSVGNLQCIDTANTVNGSNSTGDFADQTVDDTNTEEESESEPEDIVSYDPRVPSVKTISITDSLALTITEPSKEPFVDNIYTQRYQKYAFDSDSNLQLLRTKYSLDEVIKSGANEFEQQILLMQWVFAIVIANFGAPTKPYPQGALEILARFKDPNDNFQGHCVHAQEILVSAAISLGWMCRGLALKRPTVFSLGYYTKATSEHSVTEIWSNQYGKWIMLDPMQNTYVTNLEGIPLNAFEIRQDYYNNDGKNLIVYMLHQGVFPNDQPPRIQRARTEGGASIAAGVSPDDYKTTGKYRKDGYPAEELANICYLPNTNFMEQKKEFGWGMVTECGDICWAADNQIRWFLDPPYNFPDILVTQNPAKDTYFALQQVEITAEVQNTSQVVLKFKTNTPNFKYFQIRIDGGPWLENGDSYLWQLDTEAKTLEVIAVNKYNIAGAISKAAITP